MKILFISDAWQPQVNGVVRTLDMLIGELAGAGHEVEAVAPPDYWTIPTPGYAEIRLSLVLPRSIRARIEAFQPDRIHIATEGPLGSAGRKACLKLGLGFTTSYHTRFPEYLRARLPVPLRWTYAWLRRFHNSAEACLVATQTVADDLRARGFKNVVLWTRGVDHNLFKPRKANGITRKKNWKPPIFINVGRVAVEKNLEAFLSLDLPGTKLIVGDGPSRAALEHKYPDAVFVGFKSGEDLARYYNASDVFVFPSLTDTFGNVLLEALASGVPVAAYPVPGPMDVIGDSPAGVLDEDLRVAALKALNIPSSKALALARNYTWENCAKIFLEATNCAAKAPSASKSRKRAPND